MKKKLLFLLLLVQGNLYAQTPIIDEWIRNTTNKTSSYWENTTVGMGAPNYVYNTSSTLADVLDVCYTSDSVYVSSNGMTNDMGKYLNPGDCLGQNYVFRFARTPTIPVSKTISPKTGAIGLLTNGIPIYGLSNSYSYKNSTATNTNMGGDGIWNVEVYLSEGFVLDTAFAAHPQQSGAYHSHATPWRLYKSVSTSVHSPIVGYAFDGHPVYGPYGYSDAMNSGSAVTRMKTGYSLRNITVRQTLPYGVSLSPSQYGPAVNGTYPLGTYCEDYEWLAANGGDLDKYNGRFCVTPEYPSGTYAYFVTMSSSSIPEFPYYIGIEYYGTPDAKDLTVPTTGLVMPTSGATCLSSGTTAIAYEESVSLFSISPNPASGSFTIDMTNGTAQGNELNIYSLHGEKVYSSVISATSVSIDLSGKVTPGIYLVQLRDANGQSREVKKLMIR